MQSITFDPVGSFANGQNLKANSLKLQKAKQEGETGNALKIARQRLASGDQSALQDMLVLSPEETQRYAQAVGQMDENTRKQHEANLNQIGAAAAAILHSSNPEQAYQWAKTNASPEIASQMPEKYDQNWVAYHLAQAKDGISVLQKINSGDDKFFQYSVNGTTKVFKGGKLFDQGKSEGAMNRDSRENALANGGGLKGADESRILKASQMLLGGTFDMNGNLLSMDPQRSIKAQNIATDATRLMQSGKASSINEAVQMAAQKYGISLNGQGPKGGAGTTNALKPWMP